MEPKKSNYYTTWITKLAKKKDMWQHPFLNECVEHMVRYVAFRPMGSLHVSFYLHVIKTKHTEDKL